MVLVLKMTFSRASDESMHRSRSRLISASGRDRTRTFLPAARDRACLCEIPACLRAGVATDQRMWDCLRGYGSRQDLCASRKALPVRGEETLRANAGRVLPRAWPESPSN